MAAKVCPRCGAQFEKMKSATCPQCFARLVEVDDDLAAELSAARAQVERTPEFQEAKAKDDEQFREQSFGACLGVVAICIVTAVVIAVLIFIKIHHDHVKHAPNTLAPAAARPLNNDILTQRPVGGAPIGDVLPLDLPGFHRAVMDQDVTLPGTFTPLFHGTYTPGIEVYAIPAGRPTDEQNEFRLGVTLAARIPSGEKPSLLIFATEHWRYAVIGAGDAPNRFRAVMAEYFGK